MSEPTKPTISDLMCCGNCEHRDSAYIDGISQEYCLVKLNGSGTASFNICDNWQWDRLKGEDRR